MKNNRAKFFGGLLQVLVSVGILICVIIKTSGCEENKIAGTYKFDYNGNIHTVVLKKDKTATIRYSMSDEITHTYWDYWDFSEPPHVEVNGVILINPQTRMGYTSESDMRAKQNGYKVEKIK